MDAGSPPRRPWIAALLSLLCQGLGFVYAGRPAVGAIVYALSFGVAAVFVLALGVGPRAAIVAGGAAVAFWIAQAAAAARVARTTGTQVRWFARPWALAGIFVVGQIIGAAVLSAVEPYRPRVFSMPSGSMAPGVVTGDYFVAVQGARIERGAVVVHAAPRGNPRSDSILKRVVGLPGDVVEVRDGLLVLNGVPAERERVDRACSYETRSESGPWRREPCIQYVEKLEEHRYGTYCTPYLPCGDVEPQRVPPGHVFVLGDHRDHSADSRVYGPVPQEAILGRASYVILSVGSSGVRWDRIGMSVP